MALPTYSTSTVSVLADGAVTVAGGGIWSGLSVVMGDMIAIDGGGAVLISDVNADATHGQLAGWIGGAVSGKPYVVYQCSNLRFDDVQIALDLQKQVQALNTEGFYIFVPSAATEPDPSLGDDGQYAFQAVSGKQWTKESGLWSYLGIYKGFNFQGGYDSDIAYGINDVLTSGGSAYIVTAPTTGRAPPNATYYSLLAGKGDKGDRATVTVGTVTTGLPGTDVIITDTGTPSDGVLNITIPRGTPGAGDMSSTNYASEYAGHEDSVLTNLGGTTVGKAVFTAADAAAGRAAIGILYPPLGRLTLASGVPVMTTSQAGATTVYYTPYAGDMVPIYDGSNMVPTVFSERSQATTDTTKSPAAAAASKNYDLFVWNDSGTIRCTRGPVWSSDTARGTGAGTTELQMQNGIFLNKNSITNGPAANRGTYVGTIRTNASSTVDYIFGSIGAGGVAAVLNVWNAYNRVDVSTMVGDNTNTWTYDVATTWRAANSSSAMRVSMVRGLDEDAIRATYSGCVVSGASSAPTAGIGLDSTSAFTGTNFPAASTTFAMASIGMYAGTPGLGSHFVSAIEWNNNTTASTWLGDFGSAFTQTGLVVSLRA